MPSSQLTRCPWTFMHVEFRKAAGYPTMRVHDFDAVVYRMLSASGGSDGRTIVQIPEGELLHVTGKQIRAGQANAMAEVVWEDDLYAVFLVDLRARTGTVNPQPPRPEVLVPAARPLQILLVED